MSYCRFSDENFKSDVYVYETKNGYVVHVASNRVVGDITPIPIFDSEDTDPFFAAHKQQMIDMESATHVDIGGLFDGDTFTCVELSDLLSVLHKIADAGYHVPHWVIPMVEEELEGQ